MTRAVGQPHPVEVRRVGPGGSMASDNAFAVALLTLWHRVAQAGGAVGFGPAVERSEIGGAASAVVDELRSGTAFAVALTRQRDVIGFAMLRSGTRAQSHTGVVAAVMVDPPDQRQGLGRRLMQAIVELATSNGLDRLRLSIPGGAGLEQFLAGFGFTECGRLPGWIRVGPDDDRDEIVLVRVSIPPRGEPSGAGGSSWA